MNRLVHAVLLIGLAGNAAQAETPLSITPVEGGFRVQEGDREILVYQQATKSLDGRYSRANYVHPLYDLDGNLITEDFPEDHRHHRGIFWAWHQVWVGDNRAGDGWATRDFLWDVTDVRTRTEDTDGAVIDADVIWKSPEIVNDDGEPQPIVRERVLIQISPAQGDAQMIDFEIVLTALADDVRIGGSEDVKGYGGFSTRVKLPDDLVFTGEAGAVTPQTTAIEAGPWMDVSGSYGAQGEVSGMTILEHPDNPGFPQPWILREQRSMQNAAYPGREPVAVPREPALVLRYRLVLHRGPADPDAIATWHDAYSRTEALSSKGLVSE